MGSYGAGMMLLSAEMKFSEAASAWLTCTEQSKMADNANVQMPCCSDEAPMSLADKLDLSWQPLLRRFMRLLGATSASKGELSRFSQGRRQIWQGGSRYHGQLDTLEPDPMPVNLKVQANVRENLTGVQEIAT